MTTETEVLILGAGFGGIGMAITLKRNGHDDFIVVEKERQVGGTWRDNVYPGCACDVESHLYCFSFSPHRSATRVYARQPEILTYIRELTASYDLNSHLRLGTAVEALAWDAFAKRWRVTLSTGEIVRARHVVAAWGQLNRPSIPNIPGRASFAGVSFHSARWREDLSLKGLRIASIGNAASAVQYIPEIAPEVARLTVFQRSPNWVVPRLDRPYTADELRVFGVIPGQFEKSRNGIFDVRESLFERMRAGSPAALELERIAKHHLQSQVPDPLLREKLTPDYPIGCKRILRSDDYFPALTRDNVELVTASIASIKPEGIVTADGVVHPQDVVIYGTGFETQSFQGPVEVIGQNGRSLRVFWQESPGAYLGMAVPGFPNFFMLYGPNTNLGHNSILQMLEAQFAYVLEAIEHQRQSGEIGLSVKHDAFEEFDNKLQEEIGGSAWAGDCNSWYKSANGRVINNWSGTVRDYQAAAKQFEPAVFDVV